MKNKRSLYIAILLLLGVSLTIGYAVLSQSLKINGRANIAQNSWIIYFDHLVERPGSITPTTPTTINTAKDRIDFSITFDKPGDNYTFEVDIMNDGTIDAMVDSVSLSGIPEALDGIIEWEVKYLNGDELQKCDELLQKTKRRIKVVVNYNKDIEALPAEQTLNLNLTIHYVQLDRTECSVTNPAGEDPIDYADGRHTLTIDPNYGVYNDTDDVTILRMSPGEVYVFGNDPTQEVHTFDGWTVDKTDTFNPTAKMITMDDEDINAIADWTWDIVNEENNMGYCFNVNNSFNYETFDQAYSSIMGDYTKIGEDNYEPLVRDATIKLLHNCSINLVSSNYVKVPEEVKITLDLNGHKTTSLSNWYNYGTLSMIDTSDRKSGEYSYNDDNNTGINAIQNYGKLTIQNGTYNVKKFLAEESSDASVEIDRATIRITTNSNRQAISVYGGTVSISNTSISGPMPVALYVASNSSITTNISNTAISIDNSGSVQAIESYSPINANNLTIRITNSSGSANYAIHTSTSNYSFENTNIYMSNINGSAYGIYTGYESNLTCTINNNNIKMEHLSSDSQYGGQFYGIFGNCDNINNTNIEIMTENGSNNTDTEGIYSNASSLIGNNIDIKISTKFGYFRGIKASNGNFDDINIKASTSSSTNQICSGLDISEELDIRNSNIEALAPNADYVYGINSNGDNQNSNIENVKIKVSANMSGYGIYSSGNKDYTLNVEDVEINVDSNSQAFGITTGKTATITNAIINSRSTRTHPSAVSPYTNVIGISASGGTVTDSTINVDGLYGTDLENNKYVYGISGNVDVINTTVDSSAVCFYNYSSSNTINVDSDSSLTCNLATSTGDGAVVIN